MSKSLSTQISYRNYTKMLSHAVFKIDSLQVDRIINTLLKARMSDKTIFFIGNGGSAATSSHLAADLGKNTVENILNINEKRFRTISLSDNISWITAVANDLSYEDVFVEQLKNLAGEGDVLFIVSGSGNSKNIVKAASWAKTNKLSVVGLLGFDGGEVKKYTGEGLVVESDNYGIIESVHSYIHHYIVEALKPMKERNL